MNNFNHNLLNLGFNQKEIEVYLALLKLGRATPVQLSKTTSIKRVTVYAIAKNLVAKGVIAEDLAGKKATFVALPPTELNNIIEKDKIAITKKEMLINNAVAELSQLYKTEQYSVPKVRFIEEAQLEDHLYTQMIDWCQSASKIDSICWGFQDQTFVEHYNKWIEWFWKHDFYNLTVKLLSNSSQVESELKNKYPKRQIKYWNKANQFTASTWIIGDFVIMINTRVHPFYLLEIKDKTLAHNLREIFKNIWDEIS